MTTPGLTVAPPTPFTANLDVDERALRRRVWSGFTAGRASGDGRSSRRGMTP